MEKGATHHDELLTVKEYAALFRRHQQTIYTAISQGRVPYPVERPSGRAILIRVPADIVGRLSAARMRERKS